MAGHLGGGTYLPPRVPLPSTPGPNFTLTGPSVTLNLSPKDQDENRGREGRSGVDGTGQSFGKVEVLGGQE